MTHGVKVFLAGLVPSAYDQAAKLIEEFTVAVIDCSMYGEASGIDRPSKMALLEFLEGTNGSKVSVLENNFTMHVVRWYGCPAMMITSIMINA